MCRQFDSVPRHYGGVAKWLNAADCKSAPSGSVVRIHSPPFFIIGIYFNGRITVSKTVDVGSTPTIPAMAVLAKWLTHRIVAPARVGSIPTYRPCITLGYSQAVRQQTLTLSCAGSNPAIPVKSFKVFGP